MLFLLDSNIAIKSDPLSHVVEDDYDLAMSFHRLVTAGHHRLLVHPSSLTDYDRDPDEERRNLRLRALARYEALPSPPAPGAGQRQTLGVPTPGSNDAVDQDMLAAVLGDAVEFLVTEDDGIHRKAQRLGIAARVLRLADAVALIESLFTPLPQAPPAVSRLLAHELRLDDPIWDSLRSDYAPDFDTWLAGARRQQREALVVAGAENRYAAVALLKPEPGGEYGLSGPLLKVSTFKVDAEFSGNKYGELLLKTIFDICAAGRQAGIYLTVFERHAALTELLNDFGFQPLDERSPLGELVMHKRLVPSLPDAETLPALDFHIKYGPPTLRLPGTTAHVVPIEPRWHRLLFPDAEPAADAAQTLFPASLGAGTHPFGNAIRKAYLCHAASRRVSPGSPLLFYRSGDEQAVFVVGVCEAVHVSAEAPHIAALVGRRTVYTYAQIEDHVRRGAVLVLLFRQCIVLRDDPITLDDLVRAGAIGSHPQSVSRVRPEGMSWLQQRLVA